MDIVDLERDYRKSGEGANGDSYDCVNDTSFMLKMYNTVYPTEMIATELDIARKVFSLGIPSPQDVYDGILPYSCLKLFLIEFNCGALYPHFEKLIRQTFGL